jgi:hypothetical protein
MTDPQNEHPEESIAGHFTDVFEAETVPPKWIITDVLPPGLVFIIAPPKSGKSTILMGLAALVAGYECKALPQSMSDVPEDGRVMGWSYEATAGELRFILEQGLKVTGQGDGGIVIADDPWDWRLDDEGSVEKMVGWLKDRKPRLAFLDPLRNFHGLDEKDSAIVRMFAPLRKWAIQNDSALVVVHHTGKPGEDRKRTYDEHDMRGTSALLGAADGVLTLTPTGGPEAFGRLKIKALFKRARGWERDIQLAAWGASTQATEVLMDLDELVLKLITNGPITQEQIAQQVRLQPNKVRDILTKLHRMGLVTVKDRRWTAMRKAG